MLMVLIIWDIGKMIECMDKGYIFMDQENMNMENGKKGGKLEIWA